MTQEFELLSKKEFQFLVKRYRTLDFYGFLMLHTKDTRFIAVLAPYLILREGLRIALKVCSGTCENNELMYGLFSALCILIPLHIQPYLVILKEKAKKCNWSIRFCFVSAKFFVSNFQRFFFPGCIRESEGHNYY